MGLSATLTVSLDCRSLGTKLLAEVGGPLGQLNAVVAPDSGGALQGITEGSASIDLSVLGAAVAELAQRALPLLSGLPDVNQVLGTLHSSITLLEEATQHDLSVQIKALLEKLRLELQAPQGGSAIAVLLKLLEILSGAPQGRVLASLVKPLIDAAGVRLPALATFTDPLAAAEGVLGVVAGLMSLESILEEAQRLTATMAATIEPEGLVAALSGLRQSLSGGPLSLAEFMASLQAEDAAGITSASAALGNIAGQLLLLPDRLGSAMGMAEATLVYLDMGRLQAEVDAAKAAIRDAGLDPLKRVATQVAALLQPVLRLDASVLPAGQLDELAARAEREVAGIAASISSLDVAGFVTPLTDGITTLTRPLREIDQVVQQIVTALRSALGQLRDAVAALPFQQIADALRAFLQPVAAVLDAIKALLEDIETALQTAAATTGLALGQIDAALVFFKQRIDAFFADARQGVEAVNLQAAVGQVASNIEAFAQVLAQAQLKPYFDTAVSAIGTATEVIEQVPCGLLPARAATTVPSPRLASSPGNCASSASASSIAAFSGACNRSGLARSSSDCARVLRSSSEPDQVSKAICCSSWVRTASMRACSGATSALGE